MKRTLAMTLALCTLLTASCGVEPDPAAVTPTFQYDGKPGGCNEVFVYHGNSKETEFLVVDADRRKLAISTTAKTFDLAAPPEGLHVYVELYKKENADIRYCTDVFNIELNPPMTWNATKGTATITLSTDTFSFDSTYTATVVVDGATFRDGAGNEVVLNHAEMQDVKVGRWR